MRLEEDVTDLCNEIFAHLPRIDQRRKGYEYVNGLLQARGRKSIRNIAGTSAGTAAEQALHHFVSSSTWDWAPARRALADYVRRAAGPLAWVLQPMMIPKAGAHTVGVGRRFCPSLRQSLNAQHAVGLWAAADRFVTPVNWRLHLSGEWLADVERRRRAMIPDGTVAQDLGTCAVDTFLQLAAPPGTPVVLDAREMDADAVVRRLCAAGATVMVRVPAGLRLTAYPGAAEEITGTAADLVTGARHGQRPVFGRPRGGTERACLLPVRLPGSRRRAPLQLLGLGAIGGPWPGECWLTDITGDGLADLVRLTALPRQVDEDLNGYGDRVGLRDFTGRSFTGWHRHTTLASAAHALLALAGVPETTLYQAS
ncbi:IS701 family transposase [Actinoplanes sp. NPDC051494]|uniref:IS701 family transposase n=1 Tax=Actinoplanes sp. NPDC051494 TaxID=3363907 RepID=UPI0037A4B740